MTRIDIDPRTVERLLNGRVADADLPPGAEGVARVLSAARQAATESDLGAMDATVTAMAAAAAAAAGGTTQQVKAATTPPVPVRTIGAPSWLSKLLPVSVAGVTAVFGALAAAGALPSAAQGPVADLVSYVGIDIPRPAEAPKAPQPPAPTTTTTSSTTTTAPGDTTGTTAVTSDATVVAPPCSPPSFLTPSGCVEPLPEPATTVPPTTSTTQAPPPTTTSTTSTTVVQNDGSSARGNHRDTGDPGLS